MVTHFEILEAVNNKSGLDLWHDNVEAPQLPIVKMFGDWGGG